MNPLWSAEIIRISLERLLPSRDPLAERPVDILKCLLSGGVPRSSHAIEHQPRHALLSRFVGQECELERYVVIARIEPHRLGKLIARCLGLTDLEQRVSEFLRISGRRGASSAACRKPAMAAS
jgi:hypothetical protein